MSKAVEIKIYKMMVKPAAVQGCDWDEYEETEYMGEENINRGTWTGGRASNMESKNWSGIEGAV